eukprot:m.467872 g.467872  ORF g.467872 m.467872 type:complete len:225 (+) comp57067_c0_seq2:18-692(+)
MGDSELRRRVLDRQTTAEVKQKAKTNSCFHNRTEKPSAYETVKLIVLGLTLLPIRLVLILGVYVVCWLVCAVCAQLGPACRKFAHTTTAIAARVILFITGFYYIKVIGSPSRNVNLWISNHPGLFEILYYTWCGASHVGKDGAARVPGAPAFIKALQIILVSRNDAKSREQTKDALSTRCHRPVRSVPPIMVYPEVFAAERALCREHEPIPSAHSLIRAARPCR